MGKSLIITEKPSVARDFASVLHVSGKGDGYIENDEYVITWCIGHLVALVYPEVYDPKYKKWRLEDLPFLPQDYIYDVIPSVRKQYNVVHRMLQRKDISRVYWAGDAGKEGQTIEENIRNFGGVRPGMEELRVWIDSQTEEEILRGIREAKPMSEYANLGKSGMMRAIEDYAMGINFSRALSVKYGRMLNDAAATKSYAAIAVGRVMTCVLGMVVIREREIRDFRETPFYRVIGRFGDKQSQAAGAHGTEPVQMTFTAAVADTGKNSDVGRTLRAASQFNNPAAGMVSSDTGAVTMISTSPQQADVWIECEYRAVEGSRYFGSPLLYKENGFKKEADAQALIASLEGKPAYVESREKGTSRKKPPLLFNLAELQAECAKRFKISPDQTLAVAQELYEKKLTTYPRTDARVLSSAVAKEISKNISGLRKFAPTAEFAADILDNRRYTGIAKTQYVNDAKVTDHYAIIPTGQLGAFASLTSLQKSVYELIVRRFLSIFYPPAEYETGKLVIRVEKECFFASARALVKEGYLAVANPKRRNADKAEATGTGNNTRRMSQNISANSVKNQQSEEKVYTDQPIAGRNGRNRAENSAMSENTSVVSENEDAEEELKVDPALLLAWIRKLRKGQEVAVGGYSIRNGKTSPPKRYTSGSMVLAMENAGQLIEDEELREQIKGTGIGTSATRAEIIEKLVRIGYLNLNKKTQVLTPERFGEMVYEVVKLTAPAMLNPKMTASWEKGLDGITRGTVDYWEYRHKLEDFIRRETQAMIDRDLTGQLREQIRPLTSKTGTGSRSATASGSRSTSRSGAPNRGSSKKTGNSTKAYQNNAKSTNIRQATSQRYVVEEPPMNDSDEVWAALFNQL